jgi:UDP-3-O-[3-hydroxymyristoyl] glucosamine N-acyltransferase
MTVRSEVKAKRKRTAAANTAKIEELLAVDEVCPKGFTVNRSEWRLVKGSAIHRGARICPDVEIGEGCVIYNNVYVGPFCNIGNGVSIREHAHVNSHCAVEESVTITRSTLYSNVRVGRFSVIEDATIFAESIVGEYADIKTSYINRHCVVGKDCTVDDSTLDGDTTLDSGVTVCRGAHVGEHWAIDPLVVVAKPWTVSAHSRDSIAIGCQVRTYVGWLADYERLAVIFNCDKNKVGEYLKTVKYVYAWLKANREHFK